MKHATEGTAPEEPFLRKALAMYKCLDKDQKALFQYVSDLPFGLAQVSGCPGSGKNHSVGLVFAIMQHSYTNDQVLKSWSETETPAPGLELRDDLDFEELPPIELIQSEDYSHDLRSSSARDEYAERMKLYTAASPSEPEKSPDGNEADDSWNPNVANVVDETIREAIPGLGRPRRWRKGEECAIIQISTRLNAYIRQYAFSVSIILRSKSHCRNSTKSFG